MARFSARNVLHFLGCNCYRFASVWQKNVSVEFWRLFWSRAQPARPKLKTGPKRLRLAPQTYPHKLWCSFYPFSSVRLTNNSLEFCQLFGPRYYRGRKSWKSDPYDSVFHPKHTNIIRDAVLIVLRSVRLKNVSDEFCRLFRALAPPLQAELKIGRGWLCFDNRNIPTLLGTHFLSFFICTGKDSLGQIFINFSGPGTTE